MKKNSDFYQSLDELRRHLVRDQHYRVRIFDRLSPVTIIAPHGGLIEAGTSHLAQAIAGLDHNFFDFQGLRQERPWELHVTATKFRHPYLVSMLNRSGTALSLHSMGKQGNGKILIGGLNSQLKERVYRALCHAGFPVTTKAERYRGVHPQNIVNLAQNKGVQIELTSEVISRMFAVDSPLFAPDKSPLAATAYGEKFIHTVRQALTAGQ